MIEHDISIRQGLIKTKYSVPGITRNLIYRRRIAEKLDNALKYKLTFVCAPAGYGKSTAVLEWLEKVGMPTAWLSLDNSDNEPVRFWRYVIAAVQASGLIQQDNVFSDISVSRELIISNIFSDMFIGKLDDLNEDLILILDDYHLIHNETVHKSLEYFIKNIPPNIHVILLSREELHRGLSGMCAKEQVLQLNSRDLSFDFYEISDFFNKRGFKVSAEDVSSIEASTEGWVAGLVIAAFTMEEGFDVQQAISGLSGNNRHIGNFIRNEVFDRWSDEVKEFLVHTSFLDKLSGALCSKVTGNLKSNELLEMLSESNSFIIPLDRENHWFRYHHLFQEFLIDRFQKECVSKQKTYYSLAAQWYLENGYIQDSINCFIKAQEYEKAFPLIWDIYLEMTQNGEYSTWRKWMDSMPEELCENDVRACTGYSWVLSMENQLDKAQLWSDKAMACYNRIKDYLDTRDREFLEANIVLTYANIAVFKMDSAEAIRCFKRISEFDLYTPVVIGEMNSGEPNLLNTIYGFKGRLNKVEEVYSRNLGELPKFLGDFSAYIAVILAEYYYERGNLKAVYSTLVNNMGRITGLNNPGIIVPCFITLAKEKKAKGDIKGALRIVESGKSILREKTNSIWNYFFDIFTAGIYICTGDVQGAAKQLEIDRIGIFDSISCCQELEYIVYARYLILANQPDGALILLNRLEDFAQKEDRLKSRIEILCLSAIAYNMQKDFSNAMFALHKAVELGSEEGYVRTFVDEAQPMSELLTRYKAWVKQSGNDKYIEYAKELLKNTKSYIKLLTGVAESEEETASNSETAETLLSARELEVLKLLVAERSNQDIADELFITVRTVKHHNAQIYEKMKVKNRLEAIIKARELGLFEQ